MEISEFLARIASAKREQEDFVEFVSWIDRGRGGKLRDCATWMHVRDYYQHDDGVRLVNANFCKQRLLCKACARRWALKAIGKYCQKIDAVAKAFPDLIPAMVTITVKNGPDLVERVDHLKRSWTNMVTRARQHRHSPGRWKAVEWNKVAGSLRCLEVTNKGNGWHPHFHVFTLLDSMIDVHKLSGEWESTTKDSKIVDVRLCKGGIIAGLCEVIKYTTKFSDMKAVDLWEVFETLKRAHALSPAGKLRGVDVGDIDGDDLDLDGPSVDFVFKWLWDPSGYKMETVPMVA